MSVLWRVVTAVSDLFPDVVFFTTGMMSATDVETMMRQEKIRIAMEKLATANAAQVWFPSVQSLHLGIG